MKKFGGKVKKDACEMADLINKAAESYLVKFCQGGSMGVKDVRKAFIAGFLLRHVFGKEKEFFGDDFFTDDMDS